jgi:hypothetical protein
MSLVRSAIRRASRKGRGFATPWAEWRNVDHSEWRCKFVELADMHYSAVS